MSDVIAYIDGFNLYNGLKDGYQRKYLWLDLEQMCRSLLLSGQTLTRVNYFTAAVRDRPDSLRRQQKFWNALDVQCPLVHVHAGRFQKKRLNCRACGATWTSYEEKETDVGIAVALVEDASQHAFDTALIVSADSDLCPAVRAVRRLHPTSTVVAAFPPKRTSGDLSSVVDAHFTIAERKLSPNLLPTQVHGARQTFGRPGSWY